MQSRGVEGIRNLSLDPHMCPQSHQLDDHLDSEDYSEDHVEDVHDGGEQFGLFVMLREKHKA